MYGLDQTRYFTQGCINLLVVTAHKPLVKVFEDRMLDEITNTFAQISSTNGGQVYKKPHSTWPLKTIFLPNGYPS